MSIISKDLQKAIALLSKDEVIGLPTETVYGLAGNAFSEVAIRKIYAIKNRPATNPLIVHIGDVQQLETIVENIPPPALQLAKQFWPGPLTLLLPKKDSVPTIVTAGKATVAVRMPGHPLALELLRRLPFPLVAPSANPSNLVSPTSAQHVADYFREEVKFVLDGGICQKGVESTIIGFEGDQPVLYRFGAIAVEEIEAIVGPLIIFNKENEAPQAPGMLLKHYSPRTPFCFTNDVTGKIRKHSGKKIALLRFQFPLPLQSKSIVHQEVLSPDGSLVEAAHKIYATLIELDKQGFDIIIAEHFPDEALGKTLNDRLARAHNI